MDENGIIVVAEDERLVSQTLINDSCIFFDFKSFIFFRLEVILVQPQRILTYYQNLLRQEL